MRAGRQRGFARALGLSIMALAAMPACASPQTTDFAERGTPNYPGLFTPGSKWGTVASPITGAGGDGANPAEENAQAVEEGITSVQGQDRCVGYSAATAMGSATGLTGAGATTPGSLMVDFTTQPLAQNKTYTPTNVGAVWIEDAAGHHMRTLDVWADERLHALFVWLKRGCGPLEMDAISGATRPTHTDPHRAVWDGKDLHGNPVPDGMYRLNIEVTETEGDYSQWAKHDFEKGTQAWSLMPADQLAHKGLLINYSPMP